MKDKLNLKDTLFDSIVNRNVVDFDELAKEVLIERLHKRLTEMYQDEITKKLKIKKGEFYYE